MKQKDVSFLKMLAKIGSGSRIDRNIILMSPHLLTFLQRHSPGMAYIMQVVFPVTTVVGLVISAVGLISMEAQKQRWYAKDVNNSIMYQEY